jgi:hypothetical protein
MGPKGLPDTMTDWPTDRRLQTQLTHLLGYNWATLFLGDINKGTRPSRLE